MSEKNKPEHENLLFEIRNELVSVSRAINILRDYMQKHENKQEVSLCNVYLSKVNLLIAKINKHIKKQIGGKEKK